MLKLLISLTAGLLFVLPATADTLSLDAQKAVELALANNRQIQQAQEKVVEAAAGEGAAFGPFLPQISATGNYTRLAKVSEFNLMAAHESVMGVPVFDPTGHYIGSTSPIPVATGVDTFHLLLGNANNYVLRGTVQQTVFTWGKLVNAYRIAGLNVDLQREALAQARAQVKVDATSGFYQALLVQKMSALMKDSYNQLKRHVDQVQALYDNGLATKLDVMRAQVGLTNMEAQVSQLESATELALAALRNTIGVALGTPLSLADEMKPETLLVDLAQATDSALKRRPELVQLQRAAQMADLGARIARAANLPNAFAAFNYSYERPVGFNDQWGSDWNFSAGLSMPLFTGGTNLNRLKQAQSRYRQAKIGLAMVEDGIRLEVQAQVSSLNQEAKNTAYQAKNVEVAEAALQLADTRYQNGLLTNLEYMDTQLALTQSRVSYLSSLANYQIAKARLLKAMGEH
jgi:outer membrane protein TolC